MSLSRKRFEVIRFIVISYSHKTIRKLLENIQNPEKNSLINIIQREGGRLSSYEKEKGGPIISGIPIKSRRFILTLNRSPHVYTDAKDKFERKEHKILIIAYFSIEELIKRYNVYIRNYSQIPLENYVIKVIKPEFWNAFERWTREFEKSEIRDNAVQVIEVNQVKTNINKK